MSSSDLKTIAPKYQALVDFANTSDTEVISQPVTISEPPENPIVIDTRINSGNDDVEEALTSGTVYFGSSDIELGDDPTGHGTQTVGLRFQSINIPQGATIDAAYLEFVVDETGSTATNVEIRAQATDNAPAFADINRDVTSRALTSATAAWDIPAWDRVGDIKQSPDLSAAVQEVVGRTGWSANNDMVFVISGSGKRTAEAYEGISSAAPLLHVEYSSGTAPPANIAPTAGFSVSTTDLDTLFTDTSSDSDGSIDSWLWEFGDGGNSTLQNPSHTYAVAGDYTVTLTVTDDDAATDVASKLVTVSEQPENSIVTDTRISSGNDDVEEALTSGTVYFGSSDIELGDDPTGHGTQTVGLRFQSINIPQGATIDAAYLEFVVDETGSTATNVEIRAQATDDAPAFADINRDVTNRALTSATAAWDIPAWDRVGDIKQSPDLSAAVQEVVDRTGWSANNDMVFVISGSGKRTAEAYEGISSAAPLLHVEYSSGTAPFANIAPTAGFSVSTTDLTADFTDVSTDSDGTVESWAWDFGDGGTATLQNPSHTYAVAGDYTVTLTVTDNDAATDAASKLVTVSEQPEISIVIDKRISSGNDDVEEALTNGGVYFGSSDIELGDDLTGYGAQAVGLRFQSINIPQGATIDAAYLEFVVDETGSTATNVEIRAQATDNAPAFADINRDVTSRALTSATAAWDIPAWDRVGDIKQSPDLSAAVQEVVGRTGWSANNDMVFVISGSGKRTAEAYEGISSAAPLLHVEYSSGTAPPANIAPTAGFSVSTTDLDTLFTDTSSDSDGSIDSWLWEFGDGGNSTLQNPSHTYAVAGDYTVTLTVTDDDAATDVASKLVTVSEQPENSIVIDTRINSGNDDVEEALTSGAVYFGSSDIELGDDLTGYGAQTVGLRFQSINIPQGATIDAAYLEFVVDETGSTATNVEIRAQATDDAPAFADINRDVTNRALTSATAAWDIPAWDRVGDIKQSPDLSAAVQEVVDRTGWSANNDMVFVISGSGKRTAEAYEGISSAAPLLHVEYSSGVAH